MKLYIYIFHNGYKKEKNNKENKDFLNNFCYD